jgi:hypothetical protein
MMDSFFPVTGIRHRRAKIRLTEVMVKFPSLPMTSLAEITDVPAKENAPNKNNIPFNFFMTFIPLINSSILYQCNMV